MNFVSLISHAQIGDLTDASSSQRCKSIALSIVTRLTEAALGVGCLSLHTQPIIIKPNLYCSAQGSSSFPKMTLIGWKAAGTFRPMSRPISTSGGAVSCPQCEINVFTGWLIGVWRCPRVKRGDVLSLVRKRNFDRYITIFF